MAAVVDVLAGMNARFPGVGERPTSDCPAFDVPPEQLVDFLRYLRDQGGYRLLADISGVDWGLEARTRFGVVYHLLSLDTANYVRVVTICPNNAEPSVPSVTSLWPGANWHERETYDMFGIKFDGHPDLRRILMWDEYPYFPLRKDFPLAGIETPLPDPEVVAETGAKVRPAPMAGGPFVAPQEDHVSEREPRARDESWNERRPKPAN